jgi:hypothetical protein
MKTKVLPDYKPRIPGGKYNRKVGYRERREPVLGAVETAIAFRAWLQRQGLAPQDSSVRAGNDSSGATGIS